MHRILLLTGCLWALSSAPGHATVYKVVDEHGNVTYTDAPSPGAAQSQEVTLPTINRQPATEVRPTSRTAADEHNERAASYQHAAIRSPAHDATLPAGEPHLTVEVELEPALQEGHWVQVLIDGSAAGSPAQSTHQAVQDLERGMHFLSAVVLDSHGNVVAETDAITIHIRRPVVGGPASGQARPPGTVVPGVAPKGVPKGVPRGAPK